MIFPSLPIGLESTDQSVGETFRLSPPLAKAHSNPTSSPTTLRQRSDCYRDLDLPDRKRSCPDQLVRFNVLMEREMPRRVQPSGGGVCAVSTMVGKFETTGAHYAERARRLSRHGIRLSGVTIEPKIRTLLQQSSKVEDVDFAVRTFKHYLAIASVNLTFSGFVGHTLVKEPRVHS